MNKPKVHYVASVISPSEADPDGDFEDKSICGRMDWEEGDDRVTFVTCKQCLKILQSKEKGNG